MCKRLEEQMEQRRGEERFFWWKGEWRRKSSFFDLVKTMEAELQKAGFAPCQRIGSLLPNSPAFLALCVATWRLGGCVVPLNFLAGPGATLRNVQRAELFSVVVPDFAKPQLDLLAEKAGDFPYSVASLDGAFSLCRGQKQDLADPREDDAVIFFTSGTTGTPKAVPLTHGNITSNVRACYEHVPGLRGGKVMFNVLPNFHAFGFTVASILPLLVDDMGEVIMPSFMPPENTLKVLQETRSTALVAVPTMLSMLIGTAARHKPELPALELLVSGGDRFPLRLDEKCERLLGLGVLEGYGLTETSPVVSVNPTYQRKKQGTVGTLLPGFRAEVRNEKGETVRSGEEGVLWLQGPSVAREYLGSPGLTEERFRNGWFNTGDVVRLDEEGYLTVLDRVSDMMIVSGFNVYPQEVEAVLNEHPMVRESAVMGVQNPISGQVVKAYVALRNPGEDALSSRELVSFCRERLAHYKVPRQVEFVEEFPRSPIGKILKHQL
ncbi:MAG TPA: AMP-binding protein [Synergistaceae bacterium]|nr:AMP-binding protein [Synergistaceae bacterium]